MDEFNEQASEAFNPSEMSEEVAEQAHAEIDKSGRGEPLGRPEEFDDENPGDPMDEDRIPEKPAKPAPKTYKAKVNGADLDVPAEHVDALAARLGVAPEELLRGTQMLSAGQERLRVAAEKEKQAALLKRAIFEGASGGLTHDSRRALAEAGIREEDLLNFSIKQVEARMELEELARKNPDELARRQTAIELENLKAQKEATEREMYESHAAEKLDRDITAALSTGKMPKNEYTVMRLASYMRDLESQGTDTSLLNIADLVPLVQEQMQHEHTAFLGTLTGEELIQRFPPMADKIRRAYNARIRRDGPPARQPEERGSPDVERTERRGPPSKRRMSASEVLAAFRNGG